jgi:PAS domain S-box-containing protein
VGARSKRTPRTSEVDGAAGPAVEDEGALRESELRKDAILDASIDAIITIDHEGRIVEFNRAAQETFGYEAADVLGKPMAELLIPPRLRDTHYRGFARLVETGESSIIGQRIEVPGLRANGSEFPLELGIVRVELPGPPVFTAFVRDLSELKRAVHAQQQTLRELATAEQRSAESALQATTAQLTAIVDASPLAIVAIDPEGLVTMWNSAAERTFGWTSEEVLGTPLPILPNTREERNLLWEGLRRGEVVLDYETVRQHKGGGVVEVSASLAPLYDEGGNFVGTMGVFNDTGDRKHAEREARQAFELLRQSDTGRRVLLERLVRAQEEERQRIANDIHDDSVQVMTALVIRLDALRRRIDDEHLLEVLNEIERTARESISRLRRLVFELRPAALDRDGLASALQMYLEQAVADRGIAYELRGDLPSEPDSDSRAILYRIAQEALTNVLKHAGAKRVIVSLAGSDGGTVISVADDGCGFSPEDSTVPGHVGLASMRERAELSGGWWRVQSQPDRGTTVEFFVPNQPAKVT